MSINLIRFLDNQRRRAERYRVDTLRYRGVEYKKWSGDLWEVRFLPSLIGTSPYADTSRRLDGGIDHIQIE